MDEFVPTNTLANGAFDILKMDGIEDPLIDVNKLATMDFEESYFCDAVKFINECNNELTDCKIKFYHALQESTSETVMLESFSDYFVKVKDIIEKFIKFLKSLVDRFNVAVNKYMNSDKYITKNAKYLNKFTSDDEFNFDGYVFTFSPEVPSAVAALQFNANLFDDIKLDNKDKLTVDSVKNSIDNLNFDTIYDHFRAQVLGMPSDEVIYSTEFSDELYKVYRNGSANPEKIIADPTYIRNIVKEYTGYSDMKKSVDHQRADIEKAYNNVEKQVNDVVKNNGSLSINAFLNNLPSGTGIAAAKSTDADELGTTMSADLMSYIDAYVKAKVDQIQEYSNIHLLAFSAKLDAIKDCYKQDRSVLYNALGRVAKDGNMNVKGD